MMLPMCQQNEAGDAAVLLLGLSHSGKTSVGKALAQHCGCLFYDTDSRIHTLTGLTARQLYAAQGKSAFYRAEYQSLLSCFAETQAGTGCQCNGTFCSIIATGGGVCDNPKAAALAAAHPNTFFLAAEETVLFERITSDAAKTGFYPAFLHSLPYAQKAAAKKRFSALYARRNRWYTENSRIIIDTAAFSIPQLVQHIAKQLHR